MRTVGKMLSRLHAPAAAYPRRMAVIDMAPGFDMLTWAQRLKTGGVEG